MPLVRNKETGMVDLLPDVRVCCCCGAEARARRGMMARLETDAEIISITPIVYVSGTSTDKRQTKNAPKITVCRTCLVLAVGGTSSKLSPQATALYAAFRNSLAHRYGTMTGGR